MKKSNRKIQLILSVFFILQFALLNAQTDYSINGQLLDSNKQPVMFANVALLSCTDSSVIAGTVSDDNGQFELRYNKSGNYLLSASFIGFTPYQVKVELSDNQKVNIENIVLAAKQNELDEVIIKQERMKAKQQVDKTTYYVNTAMRATSNTGIDLIQHVPDIQVDLLQNVSLNGSQNIVVLVDGIERDAAFLAQIHSSKIDRIEIKNTPGAEYDAEVTGVVNIVLKKNENTGISGHIYANIPTAKDEVFSFPTASLNYAFDKLTLYTSYNGGFSFFDIRSEDKRSFSTDNETVEITKSENLYQQNWSHKVHFGADYFYDQNKQFNLYGFVSRFSNEQSGNFRLNKTGDVSENQLIHYLKDDYDINTSAYSSVFYKHIFNEGTELKFDANYYLLKSENRLRLRDTNIETDQVSHSQPCNSILKARLDVRLPLSEQTSISTGLEQNRNSSGDRSMPEFNYTENTSAVYLSANYTKNNLQANAGIRAEYMQRGKDVTNDNQVVLLPVLHLKYRFQSGTQVRLSYKKSIVRPSVFQLNPNVVILDFYTTQKGNPALRPSVNHNIHLDYSRTFGNSFLTAGLFYAYNKNCIETLTSLKDAIFLEKEIHNLGDLSYLGINASGSLKLHKNISLNSQIKVYYNQTKGNELAQNQMIADKQAVNFESALSAMFLMKYDVAFSFSAQYKSRQTRIQRDYHEDALYFVSLEKTFFDCLKAGITSAIPCKRTFTYQGYDISGMNFSQTTEDNIQMSVFPVWFKLSYTFASGKKTRRIDRDNSFKENRPKKGF